MRRVLILEDDGPLAEEIAVAFRQHGYSADIAASSERAFELFEEHAHDGVVADLIVKLEDGELAPGGASLLHKVRMACTVARRKCPPLLLISGAQAVVSQEPVWKSTGADRLLRKPVTAEEVVGQLEDLAGWG